MRTEEYALFRAAEIAEWIDEFGIEVIGMRGLQGRAAAAARSDAPGKQGVGEDAMYIVGQEEIDALTRVIQNGALFRYGIGSECDRFEAALRRATSGSKHFALAASGSNALAAAMTAVGLGPGDEVLIPAHTYMATATSVLAVGRHPGDRRRRRSRSPSTRRRSRMRSARTPARWCRCTCGAPPATWTRSWRSRARRDLIVIEDACQGVGGGYKGARCRRDRPYRRLQLQLLQEHDGRRRRRRRRQRRRARRSG